RVPQADQLVGPGRGDSLAVGRDGHEPGGVRPVALAHLADLLARLDVADADGAVEAGRHEPLAARHPRQAPHRARVDLAALVSLARLEVPDNYVVVQAARDRLLAVRGEHDRMHEAAVGVLDRQEQLAGAGVPQADRTIQSAAEDALAVARPVQARDAAGVALE